MDITQIHPFFQEGQWWAHKNPLVLYQVKCAGDTVLFKMWHPLEGITEACWVAPLDMGLWTYLWFEAVVSEDYFRDKPLRTGDVHWNTLTQQVFFLGPVTRDGFVTILSDIPVTIASNQKFIRLTQGPPDPAEDPPTVHERLLREE